MRFWKSKGKSESTPKDKFTEDTIFEELMEVVKRNEIDQYLGLHAYTISLRLLTTLYKIEKEQENG